MFVRKLNLGVPVAVAAMFAVVLVLAERQHHQGRVDQGSGMDASCRDRWRGDLRRNNGDAERGGTPGALYAAGLEGCVPPCASGGGQAGHDDDHRSRAWMEPDGRALGEAGRRDEEVCLDRDGSGGRPAGSGDTAEAAGSERAVWGSGTRGKGRGDPADPVQGPDGDRVSRAGGRAGAGTSAPGCDIQWRQFHLRRSQHAYLRQSGGFAGGGGQGILDSDWVRYAAEGAWSDGGDTVWRAGRRRRRIRRSRADGDRKSTRLNS